MGAFAAWLDQQSGKRSTRGYRRLARLAQLWSLVRPAPLVPSRTILIADFHPSRQMLVDYLGGVPARMALPFTPKNPLPDVAYSLLRTDVSPMDWSREVDEAIPRQIDTVASLLGWENVTGQTLRHWWQLRIRRLWFLRDDVRVGISPFLAGASRWLRKAWLGSGAAPAEVDVQAVPRTPPRPPRATPYGAPLRITHYISSLTSGGAERQLCNSAIAQKKAGHDVRVLLAGHPVGRHGHYLPLLDSAGIPTQTAGASWNEDFPGCWNRANIPLQALALPHHDIREGVLDLVGELVLDPPDILHCWLDWPNIVGFVASRLAGVAATLLSFRCVSPEQCPRLLAPWMRPLYRLAAQAPEVTLVANAEAGARDYERWLDLPSGQVGVIRNAFVPPPMPQADAVASLRRDLGLQPNTPVVAGVFRLDPEKRPLLFLSLIDSLRHRVPDVRVLMAGCGILEDSVKAEVRRLRLDNVVHLLGQRTDIPVILSASQVLLLASEVEGTPNVALEAQYFGCVPVLTDVGGSREAIIPGESGVLLGKDDANGLVDGVTALLMDPLRRAAMAQAGRAYVNRVYHPERIHQETMRTYAAALKPVELRRVA